MQDDVRRQALERMRRMLVVAKDALGGDGSIQTIQALVAVKRYPGRRQAELVEILGASVSTLSRQLLDLGEGSKRSAATSHGYISQRLHPLDLRSNVYAVTAKGQGVLEALTAAMRPIGTEAGDGL